MRYRIRPQFELRIHPAAWKYLVTYMAYKRPLEACGILFQRFDLDLGTVFTPIANVHPEPVNNFQMDSREFTEMIPQALSRGWRVMALVHSHPGRFRDAEPSPEDIIAHQNSPLPEVLNIIVAWARDDPEKPVAAVWKYPATPGRILQSHVSQNP